MRAFIFMWLNYLDKNWGSVRVSEECFSRGDQESERDAGECEVFHGGVP